MCTFKNCSTLIILQGGRSAKFEGSYTIYVNCNVFDLIKIHDEEDKRIEEERKIQERIQILSLNSPDSRTLDIKKSRSDGTKRVKNTPEIFQLGRI